MQESSEQDRDRNEKQRDADYPFYEHAYAYLLRWADIPGRLKRACRRWRRLKPAERWQVTAAFLIFLVTCGYTVVAYWQWQSMQGALEQAIRATQASEVSADAAKQQALVVQRQFEISHRPRFDVRFQSATTTGKTPDGRVVRKVVLSAINYGPGTAYRTAPILFSRPTTPEEAKRTTGTVANLGSPGPMTWGISPKGTIYAEGTFEISTFETDWTTVDATELVYGATPSDALKPIESSIFFGWIDYCDALDQPHRSPFCVKLVYFPLAGGFFALPCTGENVPENDHVCH